MPTFDDTRDDLVGRSKLSIYLDKEIEGTKLLSQINAVVGSYLFTDYDGKYRLILYGPLSGDAAMSFTDTDIFSVDEVTDATDIISQVLAKYQERITRDYWQVYVYDRPEAQYLRESPTPIIKEMELSLSELTDAQMVAQRTTLHEGERVRTFEATVSHRGWTLLPSDFIQITSTELDINAVMEVLEVSPDFLGNTTTLFLSAQRGLVGDVGNWGFWWGTNAVDNRTFPAALGGGTTDPWDDEWTEDQKAWARQNVGYWCSDTGFADDVTPDPDSYLPSTWT